MPKRIARPCTTCRLTVVLTVSCLACVGQAWAVTDQTRDAPWFVTWAASPQTVEDHSGKAAQRQPLLSHHTIREVLRVSAGGTAFRLRLGNDLSHEPLAITAVHVAQPSDALGNKTVAGSDRVLLFEGRGTVTVPPGGSVLTDPIAQALPPLARLVVSIEVAEAPKHATTHMFGNGTSYTVPLEAATAPEFTGSKLTKIPSRPILTGVLALRPDGRTLVCLGDSLTDGVGSTFGADRNWPDRLAERLQREGYKKVGVANAGISGNRLLGDGIGPSALSRFGRDVLGAPGVRLVVLFEGINDIGMLKEHPRTVHAGDIIAADRQMAQQAHAAGLKVVAVTLTPFRGAANFTPDGETERQAVNRWLRTTHDIDALIDADLLLRDPKHPDQINKAYDSGDHIHGSDAGYALIAGAFPLAKVSAALK